MYVNKAFCRMTGYDQDEILGRNCRFLQGPETDRASLARIRVAMQQARRHLILACMLAEDAVHMQQVSAGPCLSPDWALIHEAVLLAPAERTHCLVLEE